MDSASKFLCLLACLLFAETKAAPLLAGAAKVDITDERGPVNDRLYVRALVLKSGGTTAVLVSIDAVAIGGIGRIKDDFLPNVRAKLQRNWASRRATPSSTPAIATAWCIRKWRRAPSRRCARR